MITIRQGERISDSDRTKILAGAWPRVVIPPMAKMQHSRKKKYPDEQLETIQVHCKGGIVISLEEHRWGPYWGRCVNIHLGEDTTARELRDAEPIAMQWLDSLNKFQGRFSLERNSILIEADRLASEGLNYIQIAQRENEKISTYLRYYFELQQLKRRGQSVPDYLFRMLRSSIQRVMSLFYTGDELNERRGRRSKEEWKLARAYFDRMILDAVKMIEQGEQPFDGPDFPISGAGVKAAIKQWRRKKNRVKT